MVNKAWVSAIRGTILSCDPVSKSMPRHYGEGAAFDRLIRHVKKGATSIWQTIL
jgi:hypothetical protein